MASSAVLGLVFVGTLAPGTSQAVTTATTVTGVVFSDKNGNGSQDKGENGIKDVSVSDGVNIVQTDAQGRYRVETDPERRTLEIVFITQPEGYLAPPDEAMTPQFYRQLGELEAGQEASASFPLIPSPQSRNPNFSYGLLADPQSLMLSDSGRDIFKGLVGELNGLTDEPDFLMVAGDLTQNATDEEFVRYKAGTGTSRVPVWPVVGNHDFYDSDIYDNYREHVGPEWYSFEAGQRHFVVLENTSGFADPLQLEWLRQDLAANAGKKEVVVTVHRPMNAPPTGGGAHSPAPYIELLEQYDTVLVQAGHTHKNDVDRTVVDGASHIVTNSSGGTLDQTPNGFRVVTFKGKANEYPFKMYGVERSLTITNPAPGSKVAEGDASVQVNAYNTTSNVDDVRYRIDHGPWRKLEQSSAFTWAAETRGRGFSLGEHTMEVRVKDDAGESWTETSAFSVVPPEALSAPHAGFDWSMFKGSSAYTGVTEDVLDPTTLQPAWSYRTPGTILTSSPVIVDGVVYAGTRDENGAEDHAIHAVDLATGARLWRFRTDGQAEGTPVVADGKVYAATVRGTLFALDAATGEKVWSVTKGDEVPDGVHRGWMYEQPNYDNGVIYQVYSTGERRLMALDAATGEELWNVRLSGGWISETPPALGGGRLYVAGDNDWLVAVNAETGAEEWRAEDMECTNTTPTFSDGLLYMGCEGDDLIVLNAADGTEAWRYSSPDVSYIRGTPTGSSPAIADGVAYMGFSDGNMTALDARTGEVLWTHRTGGGIISSPIISGDTIYFGSNDGFVYGLDRATGTKTWSLEIGSWVASSPAISGNALVVGAWDGNLYAFTGSGEPADG